MILSLLYLQRTLSYWPSGLKGPLLCSTIVGGGPQTRPHSHPLHYPKELPENHTAIVPCFLPMGKWKSDCCAFRSIPTTVGKGFSWAQRGSILSVLQWNLASSQWWLVIGTKSYPENPACGKAFFQQAMFPFRFHLHIPSHLLKPQRAGLTPPPLRTPQRLAHWWSVCRWILASMLFPLFLQAYLSWPA